MIKICLTLWDGIPRRIKLGSPKAKAEYSPFRINGYMQNCIYLFCDLFRIENDKNDKIYLKMCSKFDETQYVVYTNIVRKLLKE